MYCTRIACVVILGAGLGGCAATSYQKQVADLSDGLGKVKSSFETLSEDERTAFVVKQTRVAVADNSTFRLPDSCLVGRDLSKTKCALRVSNMPILSKPAVPNGLKLAGLIAAYGQGLVSLTDSKDLPGLNEATGKAAAAIKKLAIDVKAAPAEPLGSIVSVVTWVAGQYFEQRRYAALRDIVHRANPVIVVAAKKLTEEAYDLKKNIVRDRIAVQQKEVTQLSALQDSLKHIGDELAAAEAKVNENGSAKVPALRKEQRELEGVQTTVANNLVADNLALQTLLNANVAAPFTKMKAAHAELLDALDHPEISSDAVFGKISDFLDQIDKLKAGIQAGRTAT